MKFTYRGIKYQSRPSSQIGGSEQFLKRLRLDFLTWRGISYSKNLHPQLGIKKDD